MDRKKAILDAALQVFADEGYHNASISKIAKAAGVSKGLMYNYFESKQDLLHVVLDSMNDQTIDMIKLPENQIVDIAFLECFVRKTFALLQGDPNLWKLSFMLILQPEVLRIEESKILPLLPPFLLAMRQFFEKHGSKDPDASLQFFFCQMDGLKLQCILQPATFQAEKMIELLLQQYIPA